MITIKGKIMFENLKKWWNSKSVSAVVLNWCVRNGFIFAILFVVLWLARFATEKLDTILDIMTWFAVAVLFCGIAIFAISHIKWFKVDSDDSDMEILGKKIVSAVIIFSVFMLVTGIAGLTYYINVDKNIVAEKMASIDSAKVQVVKVPSKINEYYDVKGNLVMKDTVGFIIDSIKSKINLAGR